MNKRIISFLLCATVAVATLPTALAKNNPYVLSFSDESDIKVKSGATVALASAETDTVYGCLTIRPNYEKDVAVTIPVNAEEIAGKEYVKVRYYFKNNFSRPSW